MIVVTGASGFIGSNIIKGLNKRGITNILAVGDLTQGHKFKNLAVCDYDDYMDFQDFLVKINAGDAFYESIEAVFHEGACSTTTEWDGRYMMKNNYEYTKQLFHYCLNRKIQFFYASSAAVYGDSKEFDDQDWQQRPLNVYGYSKWKFDEYVKPYLKTAESQIVGFRYFNVYGPHEQHKGGMASVAFHLMNQIRDHGEVTLFEGSHGYDAGEQRRDFVFIDDVVAVNLWFLDHPDKSGIFNLGTGTARPFNDIAKTILAMHGSGTLSYIPFPAHLKNAYQAYTQANINSLRETGCDVEFTPLEKGVAHYYKWYQEEPQHAAVA
ncbi:MAG: ADP-glyceromanno-heptose 6-epimerase [Coxiella sp. (in: Bacteria)]|nr:MAG: ADP-glyceromanno-heptose 6-epimerase [Coxiella sp. (in: g-proteobacteria)]